MKEKIIALFNELLIEGYEFPPDCGREGRLKLVVLDEAEIDEVSDKISDLLFTELVNYDKWMISREGFAGAGINSERIVKQYLKDKYGR